MRTEEDFGPIFEEFEADLGRTYVLGADPVKHRLAADLPVIFDAAGATSPVTLTSPARSCTPRSAGRVTACGTAEFK